MGRDRSRVLGTLIAYLVLIVAAAFVMDWFVMTGGGMMMDLNGTRAIDLRSVTMCSHAGPCVSVSFSGIATRGMFPMVAFAAFWGTTLVALLVTFQAGTRIITGVANPSLGKLAMFASLGMAAIAGAAGFLFAPELGSSQAAELMGITVERTLAPLLLIAAHILGVVVVHWAGSQETLDTEAEYKPIQPIKPPARAIARVVPESGEIRPIGKLPERKPTAPAVVPLASSTTGPTPGPPEQLRKKLHYATLAADVTRAGIDARREDGSLLLVMWRDVVGVVVRRLPAELEGLTFVDIVSTAGATLRILSWTRITGELAPATGDDRARALVAFALTCCPAVKLDARTQAFCDQAEAAQLPDLAKLAAHDARLA